MSLNWKLRSYRKMLVTWPLVHVPWQFRSLCVTPHGRRAITSLCVLFEYIKICFTLGNVVC